MQKLAKVIIPSIRMGEIRVDGDGNSLQTLLGSCIGLALYSRQHRIGGLAHIVLPESRGTNDRPGKYVDTAIPALIENMEQLAGHKLVLTAKLAGGASMFTTTIARRIGDQNLESCQQLLRELRIPIIAKHCGGQQGRRMKFDTGSGDVLIEIVGQNPIELE